MRSGRYVRRLMLLVGLPLVFVVALALTPAEPAATAGGGDRGDVALWTAIVDRMFESIRAVHAEGVAILLVEQNVARALEIADRAYVLEQGRIVASGSPLDLSRDPRIQEAYLGLRAGGDSA